MEEVCVNPQMKNPPLNIGTVVAPNNHPRVILYDKEKVQRDIYQANQDIYIQRKKAAKKNNEHKFPVSVLILSLVTLAIGVFTFVKRFIKK